MLAPILERWHDFYVMTGGASAALIGLLFTTMALRDDRAGETRPAVEQDLWAAASVPLTCFLDILLLSLVFLVPDQHALGLGLPVLGLAALASAQLFWLATRPWSVSALHVKRMLLPVLACYLVQAAAAAALLGGRTDLLWLLAVVTGGLILNAAITTWNLLRGPILQRAAAPAQRPTTDQGS